MKFLLFLEDAGSELRDVIKYYNDERPGLGYEFAVQVEASIYRIKQFHTHVEMNRNGMARNTCLIKFIDSMKEKAKSLKKEIFAIYYMSRPSRARGLKLEI